MKIICDRSLLADALAGVSRAISGRGALPVLEGIHLKAEGFSVTLTGYDTEIAIITTIEANVLEPGEAVIPAKLFGDLVRRMAAAEVEVTTAMNGTAHIRGGSAEFDIAALSVDDYPALPTPGADPALELPAGVLTEMIGRTVYAVSQDDKKPVHTGELFSIQSDRLTVVALDGFRLAITEQPVQAAKEIDIVIPAKTLTEVCRLLGDPEETVKISANRHYVVFAASGYTVISRLLEGAFLDYKKVIPEGHRTRVQVEVKPFVETVERASLIITERLKNPLRVTFGDGLTVRCQTTLGKVQDQLSAHVEGEAVEIGFNNRYLLDALRNSGCDSVVMELSGPLSPVKVLPVDSDSAQNKRKFCFLVLPVRFKND